MISRTSTTSTSGVTLMPAIRSSSELNPPPAILLRLLAELADEVALERFRLSEGGLHATLEDVERDDRGNGDEDADRGGDQGFRDARADGRCAGSAAALLAEV